MKQNKMGIKPILPLLITMALPAMFSMFIQSMYNIVDSMFVAQIGQDALTAVSLAFPIQNFILAVAVGTGVGVNSLISRKLGEGKKQEANKVVSHGVLLACISAFIFVIFALTGIRSFFSAYASSEVIYNYSVNYTMIVTLCSLAPILHICIEKVLQATGNMFYPMMFQLIGCVINIILDPIFIFGFGPIPAMGIEGAAIATVIGQTTSMLCALGLLLLHTHDVKLTFRHFRLDTKILKNIYAVGIPSILMISVSSFLVLGLNAILAKVNVLAVTLLGIYVKLQSFVFMPVSGLTQGAMPIMGYNYGAKNHQRLLQTIQYAMLLSFSMMFVGMLIFMGFSKELLLLFKASNELMEMGTVALKILSVSFVFASCSLVLATTFQAMGKGTHSLFLTMLRQLLIILPLAYIFIQVWHLPIQSVWYLFIVSEAVTAIVGLLMFRKVYKRELASGDKQENADAAYCEELPHIVQNRA